jgi:nickel-type superoxide dismutase maturation protease
MRKANWFDIFGLLFNYSKRYRVEGNSMLPTLQDGDEVLVKPSQSYRIGDVIVAKHPFRKTPMIKRVTEISTGGKLFLRGDNPAESSDSRTFGGIAEKDILGKVECVIKIR